MMSRTTLIKQLPKHGLILPAESFKNAHKVMQHNLISARRAGFEIEQKVVTYIIGDRAFKGVLIKHKEQDNESN